MGTASHDDPMAFAAAPRWLVMWALAFAIFAGCKWLTYASSRRSRVSWRRKVAYLVGWPGLDAEAFLHRPPPREPRISEWLLALSQIVAGAALVWLMVRRIPEHDSLLRGWVGMIGLALLLHFGLFLMLSCIWRTAGYDARPIMNWPALSTSVSDFWGRRWNTAFRDLTHRFVFRPLTRVMGPRRALFAGFVLSGIIHDLVISVPAGGGYGLPTLYFTAQALAIFAERTALGKGLGLGGGVCGWLFAALAVAGPAYCLFHPPFVERVFVPFLEAIGAC